MGAARWARLVGIAVLILALYFAVPIDAEPHGGPVLRIVLAVLALVALAGAVVAQVRLTMIDDDRNIDGLVMAILAVWVVFSYAFHLLAAHQPGQIAELHTKIDALYFTAATMLTVGYGDVHATGQFARALVLLQMLFNVVFVAAAASTLTTHLRKRVTRAQESNTQRNPR